MDEMLELNFNLRTVQRLGNSIGVFFTVEICKGEPKNLHTQIDTHVCTHTYMLYVLCRSNTDICVYFPP